MPSSEDKATRTVIMLTERLDHHRGRGQQQITVKHVTTNNVTADQAIIAEHVTTGADRAVSPALLAAGSETPMPLCLISKGKKRVGKFGEIRIIGSKSIRLLTRCLPAAGPETENSINA